MNSKSNSLPVVVECNGCGVCCLHMGYPPFIRPTEGHDGNERPGESWWYTLPEDLRTELDEFIANYPPKVYTGEVSSFDEPCFWFDQKTRQCRNHEHRPNVCRDFETGSKPCLEWRQFYRDRVLPPADRAEPKISETQNG